MPMSNVNTAESVLAAGLTIEGKIEGTGNFRVVGRFKGTVKVNGELTIEPGAFIEGEISAESVEGYAAEQSAARVHSIGMTFHEVIENCASFGETACFRLPDPFPLLRCRG